MDCGSCQSCRINSQFKDQIKIGRAECLKKVIMGVTFSVAETDPPGSTTFGRIRIWIHLDTLSRIWIHPKSLDLDVSLSTTVKMTYLYIQIKTLQVVSRSLNEEIKVHYQI